MKNAHCSGRGPKLSPRAQPLPDSASGESTLSSFLQDSTGTAWITCVHPHRHTHAKIKYIKKKKKKCHTSKTGRNMDHSFLFVVLNRKVSKFNKTVLIMHIFGNWNVKLLSHLHLQSYQLTRKDTYMGRSSQ